MIKSEIVILLFLKKIFLRGKLWLCVRVCFFHKMKKDKVSSKTPKNHSVCMFTACIIGGRSLDSKRGQL